MSTSVVYRAFNASGEVLYVGVTRDPVQRFTFHEYQTPWWHHVHRVELSQEFPNRDDAEAAEALAISTLKPLCNRDYPRVPDGAAVAEFSPYDYTPEINFPAVMRQIGTFAAQRAAMELAFKPIADHLNEPGRAS